MDSDGVKTALNYVKTGLTVGNIELTTQPQDYKGTQLTKQLYRIIKNLVEHGADLEK